MELTDLKAPDPVAGPAPWQDPDWLAAADGWITDRCAEAGFERSGPGAVRARAWSVVVRVPTRTQTLWFKANSPKSAFEPALLDALTRWAPDLALPVVAVDTQRAWSLTRHAGRTLADLLGEDGDIRHWHAPLQRYARLQHDLVARAGELLALGVPDQRPMALVRRLESALDGADLAAVLDRPDGIGREQLDDIRTLTPKLADEARELESIGVAPTLEHSDLHSGNIFLGAPDGSGATPFDWGDSGLAHPFGTLLVTLRSVTGQLSLAADDPAIADLRTRYLAPWLEAGYGRADLERAVDLALRLAPIARALAWDRMFACYAGHPEHAAYKAYWLTQLLADDPLVRGLE